MRYRFTQTLIADTPKGNRKFSAGDEIDEREILPGCLASCLSRRAIEAAPAKPAPRQPAKEPAKEPDKK